MRRFMVMIVVAAWCAACEMPAAAPTAAGSPAPARYQITYHVIGGPEVHAAIGWTDADGQFVQDGDVVLPWSTTLEGRQARNCR